MNVGYGTEAKIPDRQANFIYGSCPSTDCNFLQYLSLASLGCRMSKCLDKKKTLDNFLDGSVALSFAVICC